MRGTREQETFGKSGSEEEESSKGERDLRKLWSDEEEGDILELTEGRTQEWVGKNRTLGNRGGKKSGRRQTVTRPEKSTKHPRQGHNGPREKKKETSEAVVSVLLRGMRGPLLPEGHGVNSTRYELVVELAPDLLLAILHHQNEVINLSKHGHCSTYHGACKFSNLI